MTRARADQALREKRQHDDDQNRKGSAAEKTSHGGGPSARALRRICGPGSMREGTSVDLAALRVFPHCCHVGEVAKALAMIEPVADREAVRDLESHVANRQI